MKFTKKPNDANFTLPRPRDVWVAKNADATRFVTIEKIDDEFHISETRIKPQGGFSGVFHGSFSTFHAAEAAGLAIMANG